MDNYKIEIERHEIEAAIRSYNIDKLLGSREESSDSYIIDKVLYMFEKDYILNNMIPKHYLLSNGSENIEVIYDNGYLSSIFIFSELKLLKMKNDYMNMYLSIKFLLDKHLESGSDTTLNTTHPPSISLGDVNAIKMFEYYKDEDSNLIK